MSQKYVLEYRKRIIGSIFIVAAKESRKDL